MLFVGGGGTGQSGVATAMLFVGGGGTGQSGVTTFPPLDGTATGQMAVVEFAWVGTDEIQGTGLAKEIVTARIKRAAVAAMRKFIAEEFM